ncbi:50S ribosomal protein L13 [archaeon]|jgi:large subunit ribosomal protein L13|nr:50S ribosomal protein L13 [archaeon]
MAKLIVNGENAILGRAGSYIAKQLLKGDSVIFINCEKLMVSGRKELFVERIRQKRRMGSGGSMKGPKYIRQEDMLVKRMLRGMLPWDRPKGREAHKRLRCETKTGNLTKEEIATAKVFNHKKPQRFATMKEIVRLLK